LFRSDCCMEKWRSQYVNNKMFERIVSQKSVCVYPFLLQIHWCFGESRTRRNPVEGRVLKKFRFWNWLQKLDPVLVWILQTGTRTDGSNLLTRQTWYPSKMKTSVGLVSTFEDAILVLVWEFFWGLYQAHTCIGYF
jgi:hypothetical protein